MWKGWSRNAILEKYSGIHCEKCNGLVLLPDGIDGYQRTGKCGDCLDANTAQSRLVAAVEAVIDARNTLDAAFTALRAAVEERGKM